MKTTFHSLYTYSTLLTAIVGSVVLSGCGGADGAPEPKEAAPLQNVVRVETLVLQPTTFEDAIELTGSVKAMDDAVLSAQTAGTVVSLLELGTNVRAGQTVAQLDQGILKAALEQTEAAVAAAEAQFNLAQENFNRQQPLFRDSIISHIEFENVKAQYNQAKAQLGQARAAHSQAQEQLRYARITAPFSGTIEQRLVEKGEQVMPGTQIARIVSTDRVKITAGVPERYAGDIEMGTQANVGFQAYGGERRIGRVTFVGRAVDPANRTFPVEITMDNPDRKLKPEMVAGVNISREKIANVLVVPLSALIRDENGNSAYVVEKKGSQTLARRRPVTVGSTFGGQAVILSGLKPGEQVVVLGQNSLTEGDLVQVVQQYKDATRAGGSPNPESEAAAR